MVALPPTWHCITISGICCLCRVFPASSWAFSRSKVRELCEKRELFTPEDIDFQQKIGEQQQQQQQDDL